MSAKIKLSPSAHRQIATLVLLMVVLCFSACPQEDDSSTSDKTTAATLYWATEQGNLTFSNGGAASVSRSGTPLTITTQETGYSGQTWFVNGVADVSQAGQSSYLFSGANKEAGKKYRIGLRAAKGDVYYYAELVVTVTQ
jgi:hypothetical protein